MADTIITGPYAFSAGTPYDGTNADFDDEDGGDALFSVVSATVRRSTSGGFGSFGMMGIASATGYTEAQYCQSNWGDVTSGGGDSRGLIVKFVRSGSGALAFAIEYLAGAFTFLTADSTGGREATLTAIGSAIATPDPAAGNLIRLQAIPNGSAWDLSLDNVSTATNIGTRTGVTSIAAGVIGTPGVCGRYNSTQRRSQEDNWVGGIIVTAGGSLVYKPLHRMSAILAL